MLRQSYNHGRLLLQSEASASSEQQPVRKSAAGAPASMESMLDAALAASEAGPGVAPAQGVTEGEADPAADPGNDIFGGPTVSSTAAQDRHNVAANASGQAQTARFASPSGQAQIKRISSDGAATPAQSAPDSFAANDFTFDEHTGTWYSQEQGYFWDADRQLYGDASSGQWYSWNSSNNAYEAVA